MTVSSPSDFRALYHWHTCLKEHHDCTFLSAYEYYSITLEYLVLTFVKLNFLTILFHKYVSVALAYCNFCNF